MNTFQNRYSACPDRYDGQMIYRRSGRSGIQLSAITLGLWQNFGAEDPYARSRDIILHAFDRGVVSFDLANNYGRPYGSAEETFGRVMDADLRPYRDELFISTKAGYDMWPGPYGNFGSRKYLISSLEQSLRRMRLDYVDIFYSHRFDPETPLDETLQALVDVVRQGKALYAGISNWPKDAFKYACDYLRDSHTPCLLYQGRLSLLDQTVLSNGTIDLAQSEGSGFIAFSSLAEGVLTSKYLNGIPEGSRAARGAHLTADKITPEVISKVSRLNQIAEQRGQTLAQMATSWVLSRRGVTSVIVGCRSVAQFDETFGAIDGPSFSAEEEAAIESILQNS